MICMICESNCIEETESQFKCEKCDLHYEQAVFSIPTDDLSDVFESAKNKTLRTKEKIMNNIQLTELNVYSVPLEWVYLRYGKLKRLMKTNKDLELVNEAQIIEKFLEEKGNNKILEAYSDVEQIEMDIPRVLRKQYVPIVEERLEEHYIRMNTRRWLENEIKEKSVDLGVEMPKVTASYSYTSGFSGGSPSSSTETAVVTAYNRLDKLKADLHELDEAMYLVNKVLQELKPDEYNLVKALYFCRERRYDNVVMKELIWGRQKYYDIKKQTLMKIAYKLNII
ncbi:hypothetical protein [Paenibacillus solani]|uniref:hypothetical protein n=1 Tax=Paenibacillus solani TaxID=1705565 RepID=UPI003D2E48A7